MINLSDYDLYKASMFEVYRGSIIVFDYGRYSLGEIEQHGYNIWASGIGGGPGEFRNPTDMKFDDKGRVWLVDPKQARISIYNADGHLLDTRNHGQSLPISIAPYGGQYLVQSMRFTDKKMFKIYNARGRVVTGFGGINDSLATSDFLNQGTAYADETGYYYGPLYGGYIYKFDRFGKMIFEISTIQPIEIGRVETTHEDIPGVGEARVTRMSQNAKIGILDMTTDSKYLYILFSGHSDGMGRYIDIYDKERGDYLRSFKLTFNGREIEADDNLLYILCFDDGAHQIYRVPISHD